MASRNEVLSSIAQIFSDYRNGEVPAPSGEHVNNWVQQFPKKQQGPILLELRHVLSKTYLNKETVQGFLAKLIDNEKLTGGKHRRFWKGANLLELQDRGNSQGEMLELFDGLMQDKIGISVADCGQENLNYVYIDDGIFTGMTVINDLRKWINEEAPEKAIIHVIVISQHTNGQYYAEIKLHNVAREAKKSFEWHWWHAVTIENQQHSRDNSEVLWPARVPDDELCKQFIIWNSWGP